MKESELCGRSCHIFKGRGLLCTCLATNRIPISHQILKNPCEVFNSMLWQGCVYHSIVLGNKFTFLPPRTSCELVLILACYRNVLNVEQPAIFIMSAMEKPCNLPVEANTDLVECAVNASVSIPNCFQSMFNPTSNCGCIYGTVQFLKGDKQW